MIAATSAAAAGAYAKVQETGDAAAIQDAGDGQDDAAAADGSGFGSTLQRALEGVVQTGHEADAQSAQAISGEGNITQVVMAVSRAQMALQSTVAVRDRVVAAYQDIMKMSI